MNEQILGNEEGKQQIRSFFDFYNNNKISSFLLVSGPEGVGKRSFLLNCISDFLGPYFNNDFLDIKDYSLFLEKPHTLQIEKPASLPVIPIEGFTYENRGIREIAAWLQQSGINGKKVVLIENIERMTTSAMNAFLKICEEPLKERYLIATTKNESAILSTILSRATLVKFHNLSDEEMSFIADKTLFLNNKKVLKELLIKMSLGSPAVFSRFLHEFEKDPGLEAFILATFASLSQQTSKIALYQDLKKIHSLGMLEMFINVLILDCLKQGDMKTAEKWLEVQRLSKSSLSFENVLWYGIL